MRLPNDTQRSVIIGRTGSGKTQAAVWQLSHRSFHKRPWIIFDFKRDDLINSIPNIEYINVGQVPKHPGIYVVQPMPDDPGVEDHLWRIWERERIGLFVDEGYMLARSPAFQAILTQGRSKQIPVIILTQRPVWVSRFVFSEADFYQVFSLNDFRDRQTVQSFVPFSLETRLPPYYSFWYDVGDHQSLVLKPVPPREALLSRFELRSERRTLFL